MSTFTLNHRESQWEEGLTVASLIKRENFRFPMLVVKIGGQVVKKDERLKRIPVVVLTTSKEEQDKADSFGLGIAGYMIKPVDYKQFVDVVKTIHLYWTLSELAE